MSLLFHGPLARDAAVAEGQKLGRPLDPLGDKGLKIADSRAISKMALMPGIGDRPPSLVVGPLDSATPEAADALLKTIEEIADKPLQLIFWANDIRSVIKTIRSRCFNRWCPAPIDGRGYQDPLSHLKGHATALMRAGLEGDVGRLLASLEEAGAATPSVVFKGLEVLSGGLEGASALQAVKLWERIRNSRILHPRANLGPVSYAAALLPFDEEADS
jgi:hypothetical protein